MESYAVALKSATHFCTSFMLWSVDYETLSSSLVSQLFRAYGQLFSGIWWLLPTDFMSTRPNMSSNWGAMAFENRLPAQSKLLHNYQILKWPLSFGCIELILAMYTCTYDKMYIVARLVLRPPLTHKHMPVRKGGAFWDRCQLLQNSGVELRSCSCPQNPTGKISSSSWLKLLWLQHCILLFSPWITVWNLHISWQHGRQKAAHAYYRLAQAFPGPHNCTIALRVSHLLQWMRQPQWNVQWKSQPVRCKWKWDDFEMLGKQEMPKLKISCSPMHLNHEADNLMGLARSSNIIIRIDCCENRVGEICEIWRIGWTCT